MKDIDEPVHAFSFINKILLWLTDNESAAFQSQVIYQIPEFFYLNREGTFVLVFNNFTSETISSLNFVPIQKAYSSVIEVHLSGPRLFKFKKR
ncbi:hypothetical protein L3X38_013778 [Prunus dulcis]|nr:hypothetical protein L3X38_013778 [Prunus dulcis]